MCVACARHRPEEMTMRLIGVNVEDNMQVGTYHPQGWDLLSSWPIPSMCYTHSAAERKFAVKIQIIPVLWAQIHTEFVLLAFDMT